MRLLEIISAALLLQATISLAQSSNGRYQRRKSNLRRQDADTGEASTSLLPTFLSRAFGGGEPAEDQESPKTERKRRLTVRPMQRWTAAGAGGGPIMREFRRPFVRPSAAGRNLPNFPGAGPFAAGTISRRRNFVDVASSASPSLITSLPLITFMPISAIPAGYSPASIRPRVTKSPSSMRPRFTKSPSSMRPRVTLLSAAPSSILPVKTVGVLPVQSRRATPPLSLEGWLSYPTEAPVKTTAKARTVQPATAKDGVCGNAHSYGIKCRERMDQCSLDEHCPGTTRCCMVADCGYMCIKPKASSAANKKKKWGGASSVLKRQREAELEIESSTTAAGLKLNDIAVTKKRVPVDA